LQKIINRLNRLNDIDEILSSLQGQYTRYWYLNNYNKNLQKVKRTIENNEIILKELKNIHLSVKIEDQLMDLVERHNIFFRANTQYNKINGEKIYLNNTMTKLSMYLEHEKNIIKIQDIFERLVQLNRLKEKIDSVKNSINKGNKYIQKLELID